MDSVLSWADRAKRAQARRAAAVAAVCAALRAQSQRTGARYWLYGSTVRGTAQPTSDLDILVEAPAAHALAAVLAAERACAEQGLSPDVRTPQEAGPALLARIHAEGRLLS